MYQSIRAFSCLNFKILITVGLLSYFHDDEKDLKLLRIILRILASEQ